MTALLFDENLSPQLPRLVAALFPGGVHVRDVGLARADDSAVWDYARTHGLGIVTKDDDFRQRRPLRSDEQSLGGAACIRAHRLTIGCN